MGGASRRLCNDASRRDCIEVSVRSRAEAHRFLADLSVLDSILRARVCFGRAWKKLLLEWLRLPIIPPRMIAVVYAAPAAGAGAPSSAEN